MFINTTQRSTSPEIMDDFNMEGEILKDALDKIASINKLLGGNKVTFEGLSLLTQEISKEQPLHIVDMGCGNGDMLRTLADYAAKHKLNYIFQGIDANAFTIQHARNLSVGYENISYLCADIFDQQFQFKNCDVILCTLTLHHFNDDEIIWVLQQFKRAARLGYVINDLQRSAIAYYLFKALCFVFRLNYMSREDGLVSILSGFKKADLLAYSKTLQLNNSLIRWRWAFRYQWIVKL